MENASKGAEVLVRRRGKPYARLCPPDLPRRYPVFSPHPTALDHHGYSLECSA